MTVVEVIDTNGGFNFVRDALETHSKRALLWKIAFITFFLSAVLDNLTTTIVMIMVLPQIGAQPQRPSHLCLTHCDCSQRWWCFLPHWRRHHHHVVDQR